MSVEYAKNSERMPIKIWQNPPIVQNPLADNVIVDIMQRWQRYSSSFIDLSVAQNDDMHFKSDDGLEGYLKVGRSAVRIIAEAMLLAGRGDFGSVLDLPCGGGRVTRHLTKFLPDSELFVADIDQEKEQFVIDRFNVRKFSFQKDYVGMPSQKFDLIFCGSLLTHFDRPMFNRALNYFIEALSPSGLAVVTLHGRSCVSHDLLQYNHAHSLRRQYIKRHLLRPLFMKFKYTTTLDQKKAINGHFMRRGFGYFSCPLWSRMYGQSYGGSYTAPSWAINRVEARADCRILGYKEMSFADYQDVLIVQKI